MHEEAGHAPGWGAVYTTRLTADMPLRRYFPPSEGRSISVASNVPTPNLNVPSGTQSYFPPSEGGSISVASNVPTPNLNVPSGNQSAPPDIWKDSPLL